MQDLILGIIWLVRAKAITGTWNYLVGEGNARTDTLELSGW
jgi:hypothetical protein